MVYAYNKMYLEDAINNLGEAADYAINDCHMDLMRFFTMFSLSSYAKGFEKGSPRVISGMSGIEMFMSMCEERNFHIDFPSPKNEYSATPEFWTGRTIALFQWYTGSRFTNMFYYISPEEIYNMYPALHEASEYKCITTIERFIANKKLPSRLQHRRKQCGLTQSELAQKAEVNIRTLQQYENKAKNINKASADTLCDLANILSCDIEDIMEIKYLI